VSADSGRALTIPAESSVVERVAPPRRFDPYALAAGSASIALAAAVFMLRLLDRTPPFFDPVEHFLDGLYLLHDPRRSYLLDWRASYPFFDSVVAIPFNLIGSYSYMFTTACLGALFLAGTVFVTFLIGRDLFGREAGLVAALYVGLYPGTFGLSLTYLLDLSMTFMVALTMLFLVRSRTFSDRRSSLFLGAALGIGTFTRYTFALWIALPVGAMIAACVCRNFLAARRSGSIGSFFQARPLRNILDAALISSAIATPWYLPRLSFLLGDYIEVQRRNNAGYGTEAPLISAKSLLYYPRSLWHIASLPLSLAFVLFGIVYVMRRGAPKLVLLSWIIGGYLAATLPVRSDTRFFVAILPAVALVTAGGMAQLARGGPTRRLGSRIIAGALVSYSAIQLYGCTVGIRWLPTGPSVAAIVYPNDQVAWFSQDQAMVPRIHRHAWDPSGVVAEMKRRAGTEAISVKIIADSIVASALKLPIVRTTLTENSTKFLLFESGDRLDFPTDFIVVETPVGRDARGTADEKLAGSLGSFDVNYRIVYEDRLIQPFAGQELFLYQRVK
jgi:hypothetical protein